MIKGIIYSATSPNGKKYFGQTTQKFKRRKKDILMMQKMDVNIDFIKLLENTILNLNGK